MKIVDYDQPRFLIFKFGTEEINVSSDYQDRLYK